MSFLQEKCHSTKLRNKLERIRRLCEKVLQQIKDYYDIDLTEDEELIKNLQIHLMGLKNRIEHNTFFK